MTIFHIIFFDISHIQYEGGKYQRILCGILSVPPNTVTDVNDVMLLEDFLRTFLISMLHHYLVLKNMCLLNIIKDQYRFRLEVYPHRIFWRLPKINATHNTLNYKFTHIKSTL